MTKQLSRQSFLGEDSERIFEASKIGVIGLSGGGSHVVQQSAHVGVGHYVVIDPKIMEHKHLHRIVGATADDVRQALPKAKISERVIKGIRPHADVQAYAASWQEKQMFLRDCTAIFGCVDSYSEREQIERFCRRFLIPFFDIGMDVFSKDGASFHICGQAVLTAPGHPCLRCMGVISERLLKDEAATYGAAGPKPQVIWPNAILAAAALGLFVQLVCPWHPLSSACAYLEYNGNFPFLRQSPRMEYAATMHCEHFQIDEVGDPFFRLPVM